MKLTVVTPKSDLKAILESAQSGDTFYLKSGVYTVPPTVIKADIIIKAKRDDSKGDKTQA